MARKQREFLKGVAGWARNMGLSFHGNGVTSLKALSAIQARHGLKTQRALVEDALRLYAFMSEASKTGPVYVVVHLDDNVTFRHQAFPKTG